MNPQELYDWIDSLAQDISFKYHGVCGSICPFNRQNISISFGADEKTFDSIEAVLNEPFIDGKPLQEICQQIQFE